MNCDGVVSIADVPGFVAALTDPNGYAQQFPECNMANGDIDEDTVVNGLDIQGFMELLVAP